MIRRSPCGEKASYPNKFFNFYEYCGRHVDHLDGDDELIHHYNVTLLRDLGPFKKGRQFSEALFELESENPVIHFVEIINEGE